MASWDKLKLFILTALLVIVSTVTMNISANAQSIKQRLQQKSKAAMAYLDTLKKDPAKRHQLFKVVGILKQVKPLVESGKPFKAEKLLDQVLALKSGTIKKPGHQTWSRITVPGVKTRGGIFDPSIVHDPKTGTLWMAYSTIFGPGKFPDTKAGPFIRTSLAKSTDAGKNWTFVKHLNTSKPATLNVRPLGKLNGAWRAEVPQLVYTPGDKGREWKLFVHRYFWDHRKDRIPVIGWIAYSSANHPTGNWSKETPYFGATKQFPLAPFNKTRFTLTDIPQLKQHNFVAYSETGALYHQGTMYIALVGLKRHGPDSIILLASKNYGKSWKCVKQCIIANRKDAQKLGYRDLDGIGLTLMNNSPVLFASPGKPGLLHDGTMIIPFADISSGKLARMPDNRLKIIRHIKPQQAFLNKTGGGQSTYSEWRSQKVFLMPQTNFTTYPDVFNIYKKGR